MFKETPKMDPPVIRDWSAKCPFSTRFGRPKVILEHHLDTLTYFSWIYVKVQGINIFGAGSTSANNVWFEDLSKDLFLEIQNEKCS